ncbi:hypothetical protein Tco_0231524 [Tanacetum coccineum]
MVRLRSTSSPYSTPRVGGMGQVRSSDMKVISFLKEWNWDCKMVVKEIVGRLLEEEEKLEWWFEQDIDKEEERFKGDEDGGEV